MGRGLGIELSRRDRQQLDKLLSGGLQPVRTVLRGLALRQLDDGWSTAAVGANLGLSAQAVWQIGKRYLEGGLERALFDATRPGKAQALDQEQRQRIIAVACSPPPEGRARWTVRLLTEEAIRRRLVPRVGRETIRVLLESHDLKPCAGNCVKKDREVCAVRMMKAGPSEPLCKRRLQTAVSGLCRKTVVVNVTVKRRGLITSGMNERGECE
jgi:transposase